MKFLSQLKAIDALNKAQSARPIVTRPSPASDALKAALRSPQVGHAAAVAAAVGISRC